MDEGALVSAVSELDPQVLQEDQGAGATVVEFALHSQTRVGERHKIVGSSPELGGWEVGSALELEWAEGHIWKGLVKLPPDAGWCEFKCVKLNKNGSVEWQGGDNHRVEVSEHPRISVHCSWYSLEMSVEASEVDGPLAPPSSLPDAGGRQPAVSGPQEGVKESRALEFVFRGEVQAGRSIGLVGSAPFLGNWDPGAALRLSPLGGNVWSASVELLGESVRAFEFKCVQVGADGSVIWRGGDNSRVQVFAAKGGGTKVPDDGAAIGIQCGWDTAATKVYALPETVAEVRDAERQEELKRELETELESQIAANRGLADRVQHTSALLDEERTAHSRRAEEMHREVDRLRERLRSLQAYKIDVSAKMDESRTEIDDLKLDIGKLTAELGEERAMSAALRSGLKSLQDQLSRTQRSLGEREAELSQLKERVTNEYQAGIEKKLALAAELRQQLQESSVDARVTRASLKDAQRILTDRNAQLAGLRGELTEAERKNRCLQGDLVQVELRIAIIEKRCSGEMEQLQGEVEQLRSDRDEMRLKLSAADASASETAAVRKEAEELRANAQVWSSEKAGLLEENSALRANQDSLRAASDEAASEMAAVKGEVEDLRSAALDWAGKKAGLLEKIGVLKADRDVLRLRLAASGAAPPRDAEAAGDAGEDHAGKPPAWPKEKAKLLHEIGTLKADRRALRLQLEASDASLAELAAINKQDQDLGADALAWCRERSELLYEIGTLKADMETLRLQMAVSEAAASKMSAAESEAAELRASALEWSNEKLELLDEIGTLADDLETLRMQLAASDMATSETAAAKGEAETLRANAAAWSKEKAELLEEISVLEQVVDLLPKPDMEGMQSELAAGRAQVREEIERSRQLEVDAVLWREAENELEARLVAAHRGLQDDAAARHSPGTSAAMLAVESELSRTRLIQTGAANWEEAEKELQSDLLAVEESIKLPAGVTLTSEKPCWRAMLGVLKAFAAWTAIRNALSAVLEVHRSFASALLRAMGSRVWPRKSEGGRGGYVAKAAALAADPSASEWPRGPWIS